MLLGCYFSCRKPFFSGFFLNLAFMLRFIKAIRFVEIWLVDLLQFRVADMERRTGVIAGKRAGLGFQGRGEICCTKQKERKKNNSGELHVSIGFFVRFIYVGAMPRTYTAAFNLKRLTLNREQFLRLTRFNSGLLSGDMYQAMKSDRAL